MADVWGMREWEEALIFFYPRWKGLSHDEFRKRRAWAMLTLGKAAYPADEASASAAAATPAARGVASGDAANGGKSQQSREGKTGAVGTAPLPGAPHSYVRLENRFGHRCSYYGAKVCHYCSTCALVIWVSDSCGRAG
eukprot:6206581-Pleurochrysis_carterae.AAC.5